MQDPSLYQQINPQFPEHEHLKCPRCDSDNTKFCYYNNYNLSQPRHYCKNCRRYWTKGGSLRNIPVGGGSRKTTKRSSSKRTSSSSSSADIPKSDPLDRNQTVDPNRQMILTANDQFRSLFEGLNSNGFGNDSNLSLNSGSDQNLMQNPITESNNEERYSSFDENGGNLSYWGSGHTWPNLAVYNHDSTFQQSNVHGDSVVSRQRSNVAYIRPFQS